MQNTNYILAIETSCDETAVAIYEQQYGLLAHCLYSQITTHLKYGGVVPELASRDHIRKLMPLITEATQQAKKKSKTLGLNFNGLSSLTAIGYTKGPGLIGSLLVGAALAKTLSFALKIPALEINHHEGHILAPLLENQQIQFPYLALIISGGHTILVIAEAISKYKILGKTLDDAVGEAFDKTAKLLELGYPGGPQVETIAKQAQPHDFEFPCPMIKQQNLNMSFSGLKTHTLNTYLHHKQLANNNKELLILKAKICDAFQTAVIKTLISKSKRALKQSQINRLVVSGGVAANKTLRTAFDNFAQEQDIKIYYPSMEFSTDNAAMIAISTAKKIEQMQATELQNLIQDLKIEAKPRWSLEEIMY